MPEYSLDEIAKRTGCELVRGKGGQLIGDVSTLQDGREGELIFWVRPLNRKAVSDLLAKTKATAIMVAEDYLADARQFLPADCAILVSSEPERSFIECLTLYQQGREITGRPKASGSSRAADDAKRGGGGQAKAKWGKDVIVEPSAVIGEGVVLGDKCYVGAGAVIGDGAALGDKCYVGAGAVIAAGVTIGADCIIKAGVILEGNTRIGGRVIIHSGAVIGTDGFGYIKYAGRHNKIPHLGGVVIEDEVEIGANTTIDRGTMGHTKIGAGTKIDNQCQVGHNTIIGKNCILCGHTALAGSVTLGDDCIFTGKAGCIHGIRVGAGTVVHAGAIVVRDTEPGSVISGLRGSDNKEYLQEIAALKLLAKKGRK